LRLFLPQLHQLFHSGLQNAARAIRILDNVVPYLLDSAFLLDDPRMERTAIAIDMFIGDVADLGMGVGHPGHPGQLGHPGLPGLPTGPGLPWNSQAAIG
jgi:hypothetical protein